MAIFVNHRASQLPETLCGAMRLSDQILCRFAPGHRGGHSWETTTATLGELEALDADHSRLRKAVEELAGRCENWARDNREAAQCASDASRVARVIRADARADVYESVGAALREILERESWTT